MKPARSAPTAKCMSRIKCCAQPRRTQRNRNPRHDPDSRGFTLIEMAIVLIIITILIGGLAVPLSAQIQARRIAETKKTLEEAREAIIGYAMTHNTRRGHAPPLPALPRHQRHRRARKPNRQPVPVPKPMAGFPGSISARPRRMPGAIACITASKTGNILTVKRDAQPGALYTPPYANLNFKQICRDSTCATLEAIYVPVVLFSHRAERMGGAQYQWQYPGRPDQRR